MGKTVQVVADRAYDQSKTVLPAEVARGTYMQNPPGLAALKLMHLLIAKAGGRMGEDVEHRVRLSEVRGVEGLRNHDRASLAPLFAELQAAVLIHDDTEKKRLTIGAARHCRGGLPRRTVRRSGHQLVFLADVHPRGRGLEPLGDP